MSPPHGPDGVWRIKQCPSNRRAVTLADGRKKSHGNGRYCGIVSLGMSAQPKTIWTIGHSTRKIEEFIGLLKEQHIAALADVRRYPGSRRHPQFGQEQLAAALGSEEIAYVHFDELGGRRPA